MTRSNNRAKGKGLERRRGERRKKRVRENIGNLFQMTAGSPLSPWSLHVLSLVPLTQPIGLSVWSWILALHGFRPRFWAAWGSLKLLKCDPTLVPLILGHSPSRQWHFTDSNYLIICCIIHPSDESGMRFLPSAQVATWRTSKWSFWRILNSLNTIKVLLLFFSLFLLYLIVLLSWRWRIMRR